MYKKDKVKKFKPAENRVNGTTVDYKIKRTFYKNKSTPQKIFEDEYWRVLVGIRSSKQAANKCLKNVEDSLKHARKPTII